MWPTLVAASMLVGCAQPPEEPSVELAERLLAELDQAFNRGSRPGHESLFAAAGTRGGAFDRTQRLLKSDVDLVQTSRVEEFRMVDGLGVALARTQFGAPDQPHLEALDRVSYLVFAGGDERRALLHVDVSDLARHHVSQQFTGVFRCEACDFRIGDDTLTSWLVVPSPRLLSGCIETVTFYRVGADLQLMISICRNPQRQPADELLTKLIEQTSPDAAAAVEPWVPPAFTGELPAGMQGARCNVGAVDGPATTLHLLTRGGAVTLPEGDSATEISYLLTVQGAPAAREAYSTEIDTWLRSFALMAHDTDGEVVGARAAAAHSGGVLSADGTYENAHHQLRCRGPEGWRGYAQADRCWFGVSFEAPDSPCALRLTAYPAVAAGAMETRERIEAMVRQRLIEMGHTNPPAVQWDAAPPTTPPGVLAAGAVDVPALDQGAAAHRGRLLVFEDLWLLVDAEVHAADVLTAQDALLRSIRR
ncbi:MAG: hypothetical protein AAF628_31780 [Planctomycetota bacterium]